VASDEVRFTITLMGCPDPGVMRQEQVYTDALQAAASRALVDGRLEFRDAAGALTLVFEAASSA
jgi:hypothetical protein